MRFAMWAEIIIGIAFVRLGMMTSQTHTRCAKKDGELGSESTASGASEMDFNMYYHMLTTRRICPLLHHASPIIVPKRKLHVIISRHQLTDIASQASLGGRGGETRPILSGQRVYHQLGVYRIKREMPSLCHSCIKHRKKAHDVGYQY